MFGEISRNLCDQVALLFIGMTESPANEASLLSALIGSFPLV